MYRDHAFSCQPFPGVKPRHMNCKLLPLSCKEGLIIMYHNTTWGQCWDLHLSSPHSIILDTPEKFPANKGRGKYCAMWTNKFALEPELQDKHCQWLFKGPFHNLLNLPVKLSRVWNDKNYLLKFVCMWVVIINRWSGKILLNLLLICHLCAVCANLSINVVRLWLYRLVDMMWCKW